VDDEPLVTFLQRVLEQQGCTAWLAADGQEGLRLYQQHGSEIGLVLLDVRMPGDAFGCDLIHRNAIAKPSLGGMGSTGGADIAEIIVMSFG
jgi:CheY-like chemotaxis protein